MGLTTMGTMKNVPSKRQAQSPSRAHFGTSAMTTVSSTPSRRPDELIRLLGLPLEQARELEPAASRWPLLSRRVHLAWERVFRGTAACRLVEDEAEYLGELVPVPDEPALVVPRRDYGLPESLEYVLAVRVR